MQLANSEAQRFNHEYIGTEHLLLGLVKLESGTAHLVLAKYGIDLRTIRLQVEKIVQSGPELVTMGKLPQTPRAKKVIEYAMEEARNLNHNYVGTEHLLLGLLRENEGVAAQALMNLGIMNLEVLREETLRTVNAESCGNPYAPDSPMQNFIGWAHAPLIPNDVEYANGSQNTHAGPFARFSALTRASNDSIEIET